MHGLGERMRERARELGWSDSEVARRLGMTQQRYARYVADATEPDLLTLVRICSVLGMTPDTLLLAEAEPNDLEGGLTQTMAALRALDIEGRSIVAAVVDGLLCRTGRSSRAGGTAKPVKTRL